MAIWVAMAVLAAAAFVPVLMALTRSRGARSDAGRPTVAIYRDQLDEVERDVSRGLIGESEAAAARTEIARRLIHADEAAAPAAPAPATDGRARRFATVAVVAMPLAALAFYLVIGSPQMPDEPLAARLAAPPQSQDIATLVARVEQHLAANPDDGAGWQVVGPVYMRLGRYADAVRAYQNARRLLGSTAETEGRLGEAIVAANDGTVTEDARAAFERALALAPDDVRARFFLAMALGQQGRHDEAVAAWQALIASAPADASWLPGAQQQLAELEGTAPASGPGPSAADVAAASKLAPNQQNSMIEGMVAQLAARLETDGSDADGWARLIRSYMVLNRPDDARAALERAHTALAGDATKLALVDTTASNFGLMPSGAVAEQAPAAGAAPGPSAADVAAASKLAPDQQNSMIEGMVAQLAARLETDGSDADGWARLIRSYAVLGRPDDARAALDKAHAALAGDADKLAQVDATARDVGLMPPEAVAGQAPPAAAAPGPTAADVAAASKLAPDQQNSMIEGMVAKLAARLETDGSDADGWAQLIRSYAVLGRPDDARAALDKAHAALAGDAAKIASVDATARDVGLMPPAGSAAPMTAPAPDVAGAAAAHENPDQQQAGIDRMVAGLAARLETDTGDADGWALLVRSYMVLGKPDDARAALDKAHTALAGDAAKLAQVDATARDSGLIP